MSESATSSTPTTEKQTQIVNYWNAGVIAAIVLFIIFVLAVLIVALIYLFNNQTPNFSVAPSYSFVPLMSTNETVLNLYAMNWGQETPTNPCLPGYIFYPFVNIILTTTLLGGQVVFSTPFNIYNDIK